MTIDPISVTAIATSVYGLATFLLWWENRQDRQQRDRQFRAEADSRKLNELHRAFYEATGYWEGFYLGSPETRGDAVQIGRLYEALYRFECQLRLNGFTRESQNLGVAVRTEIQGVMTPLAEAGVAIGILPSEYHRVAAVVQGHQS
jgi:hypothetical protein